MASRSTVSRTRRPAALGPVVPLEDRTVPAAVLLLDSANNLLRVDSATPATVQSTTPVTGLTAGETLVGIDVRPATGEVYGLGATFTGGVGGAVSSNTVTTYAINPNTGIATPRGTATVGSIIGATAFGFDFNPVPDRIRVTTDLTSDGAGTGSSANNFRLNPNDGALVAVDPDLDASGVTGGNTNLPETAVAYTNNFAGTTATTLFGILTGGDRLVRNTGAPGFATLVDVGPLGVLTTTDVAGFDISGQNNTALAVLRNGALSRLFSINLGTGTATALGVVGTGVATITDLTILGGGAGTPSVASGRPDGSVVLLKPGTTQASGLAPVTGQLTVGQPLTPFAGVTANVRTATADINGDQIEDIIAVTGPGTPVRVTVISGADNSTVLVAPFDPFEGFTGGGFVSAGDFNGDGRAEFVVTPDRGGGPRVSIYSLPAGQTAPTRVANFFTIDSNFRGGARSAVGRVNTDATPDLAVAAGFGGGPRVTLLDGTKVFTTNGTTETDKLIGDFFVFPDVLRNGVYIAIGDVNGDGFGDLVIGAGPGGGPQLLTISGQTLLTQGAVAAVAAPLSSFFVGGTDSDRGGVRVSVNDLDGDNRADIVTGTGEARPARVRAYLGKNFTNTAEPTVFQDVDPFAATLPDGVYVG